MLAKTWTISLNQSINYIDRRFIDGFVSKTKQLDLTKFSFFRFSDVQLIFSRYLIDTIILHNVLKPHTSRIMRYLFTHIKMRRNFDQFNKIKL